MPMIHADLFALCRSAGIREVAWPDVEALFPNDDGESFSDWLARIKPTRPHWFATSTANTENAPELFSIDAQGRYAKQHGEEALAELLETNNLRPGETLKPPKVSDGSDTKGENNPWSKSYTGGDREAHKASIIKKGTRFAASMAASAGFTISGFPLKK